MEEAVKQLQNQLLEARDGAEAQRTTAASAQAMLQEELDRQKAELQSRSSICVPLLHMLMSPHSSTPSVPCFC